MSKLPCGCTVGPDFEILAVASSCQDRAHHPDPEPDPRQPSPPYEGPRELVRFADMHGRIITVTMSGPEVNKTTFRKLRSILDIVIDLFPEESGDDKIARA